MKFITRVLGFLLIVVVAAFAALFFLESHNMLGNSELADFVRMMHIHYEEVKETTTNFFQNSGIAENAADLMDKGAQKLRESQGSSASQAPAATPVPAGKSSPIIFDIVTPKPAN